MQRSGGYNAFGVRGTQLWAQPRDGQEWEAGERGRGPIQHGA